MFYSFFCIFRYLFNYLLYTPICVPKFYFVEVHFVLLLKYSIYVSLLQSWRISVRYKMDMTYDDIFNHIPRHLSQGSIVHLYIEEIALLDFLLCFISLHSFSSHLEPLFLFGVHLLKVLLNVPSLLVLRSMHFRNGMRFLVHLRLVLIHLAQLCPLRIGLRCLLFSIYFLLFRSFFLTHLQTKARE